MGEALSQHRRRRQGESEVLQLFELEALNPAKQLSALASWEP